LQSVIAVDGDIGVKPGRNLAEFVKPEKYRRSHNQN